MYNRNFYNDFSADTDLQTFLDTEAVQTKRIRHKKHLREIGISIAMILAVGAIHEFFPNNLGSSAKHIAGQKVTNTYSSQMVKRHLAHHSHELTFRNAHVSSKGEAAITLDADTGRILYAKNINRPYNVSSLSKLMTMYLVQKKANHDHAWNKVVPIPLNISGMSYNQDINNFKLNPHKKYTVKQLYEATGIASSNSAATALGAWVSGGTHRFVRLMNFQAKVWHLNAHFVSASGLNNKYLKPYNLMVTGTDKESNSISASDMAKIVYHLIKVSPNVDKLLRKPHIDINGQLSSNANNILRGQKYYIPYHLLMGLEAEKQGLNKIDYVGFSHSPNTGHKTIVVVLNSSHTKSGLTFLKKISSKTKNKHQKSLTINQLNNSKHQESDSHISHSMPLRNNGSEKHAHF